MHRVSGHHTVGDGLTDSGFTPLAVDQAFYLQWIAVLQRWRQKRIGIVLEADRAQKAIDRQRAN